MPRNLRHPDPSTLERLVAGQIDPADAPPGYRSVAALLQQAGTVVPESPKPGDEAAIGAMVAAIESADASAPSSPSGRRILRKVVVAAVSMATLSAGGVAAASGDLPDPIQNTVSVAAEKIGIDIPRGHAYGHLGDAKDAQKEADKAAREEEREQKKAERDARKAKRDAAKGENGDQADDAAGQGQGSQISGIAQTDGLDGVDKGQCVSDAASGDQSRAGDQAEVTAQCPEAEQGEAPAGDETPPVGDDTNTDDSSNAAPDEVGPAKGASASEGPSDGRSQAGDDHGAPDEG